MQGPEWDFLEHTEIPPSIELIEGQILEEQLSVCWKGQILGRTISLAIITVIGKGGKASPQPCC